MPDGLSRRDVGIADLRDACDIIGLSQSQLYVCNVPLTYTSDTTCRADILLRFPSDILLVV